MNKDRLTDLAHFIERLPRERLDMRVIVGREGLPDLGMIGLELETDRGTAGCIAGWTCAVYAPARRPSISLATKLLELTGYQAEPLFFPRRMGERTQFDAAAAIRSLVDTGEVQWPT